MAALRSSGRARWFLGSGAEPGRAAAQDCEGIDAYDQTGSYSVQLFSLAVLCSSLFLYNQMGGIDEAALERLQLIVEMTKHIKVGAVVSSGRSALGASV